jgi:hypothetical protein
LSSPTACDLSIEAWLRMPSTKGPTVNIVGTCKQQNPKTTHDWDQQT